MGDRHQDTLIAYPGEITRLKATFDREGQYTFHCHILEHEDNEMMGPYCVGAIQTVATTINAERAEPAEKTGFVLRVLRLPR